MATHPSIWPGESHEQRILVGYSTWGHKESNRTKPASLSYFETHQKYFLQLSHSTTALFWEGGAAL